MILICTYLNSFSISTIIKTFTNQNKIKRSFSYYWSHIRRKIGGLSPWTILGGDLTYHPGLSTRASLFVGICCIVIWSPLIGRRYSDQSCQIINPPTEFPSICWSLCCLAQSLSHFERDTEETNQSKGEELICIVRYNNWYLNNLHGCWKWFCYET